MCSERNAQPWRTDPSARVPRWQSLCHAHINKSCPVTAPKHLPRARCPALSGSRRDSEQALGSRCSSGTQNTPGAGWIHRNSKKLKWCGPENKTLAFQVRAWIWRNIYQYTCYYASVTAALWVAVLLFFSQLLTKLVCINSLRLAKF